MVSDGHKNLASQMPALFAAMQLVLKMHRGSAVLRKEFGKLQNCCQATVAAVIYQPLIATF